MNNENAEYFPRIADTVLRDRLRTAGAVVINGVKGCGKRMTAEQVAGSAVYLQDQKTKEQNIALAKSAPDIFLEGAVPRLIDEWQVIPFIWDQIRFEVDHRRKKGQFILTGSNTPVEENAYEHSGIGRIVPMTMRTMSLYESRDGNGTVSLETLFENPDDFVPSQCSLGLRDYAYLLCRGGWPSAIGMDREDALEEAYNFYNGLVENDINKMFKRKKNPERVKRLMKSYARAVSTETPNARIRADIISNDEDSLDEDTICSYINALTNLFVIEELPAWNANLRSRTAIRKANVRHFSDPSIGCAAMGLGPEDLIKDLETFGLFFESMCIRDLRVYTESLKGQVYHYRDARGREADAIIHLRNGRWGAVEVKLTSSESIEEGARHLLSLAADIDTEKEKAPSFLMIVTATPYAYRREDGIFVVPLGCLKP